MISVQLFHIGVITLLNLMAIGVIHYLRRWLMRVEITRKLAHISSGLLGLLLPRFFPVYEAVWPMITLWICFSGFLYFTYRRKLLSAINGIDRKTVGAYIMPTTLTSLWLFNRLLFQKTGHNEFVFYDLPLLVLTFGDSLAAFIGSKYGRRKIYPHSQKTWVGFVTILFVTFSISVFYLHFISKTLTTSNHAEMQTIGVGILLAISAAIAEAFSVRGWDNLTIPIGVFFVLTFIL